MPCLVRLSLGFVALLLLVTLGVPHPAVAAEEMSGARIRLRLDGSDSPWQHGTLLRTNSDSLWYFRTGEGDTLAVERSNVSRLQAFDGRRSRAETGAMVGLGVGVAVGAVYGLTNMGEGNGSYSAGELFLSVGFFGASGLLLGALCGSLMREDKWVDVPRLGLSIQGTNDSVRLSIGFGPPPQGGSR